MEYTEERVCGDFRRGSIDEKPVDLAAFGESDLPAIADVIHSDNEHYMLFLVSYKDGRML